MQLNGAPANIDQIKALALTNYGHFTSMLVERGGVRGLSLHMERLVRDCRHLFNVELDTERVRAYVRKALGDSSETTVARVTIYDPAIDLGTVGSDADPAVLVTTRTAAKTQPAPWHLQAVSYRRDDPAIKHIGLYGAMMQRRSAQREGFDDVLFLNPDGTISEIATSNIGFIRDDQVIWPRSECLVGTTMTLLRRALDETVDTQPLTLSDLPTMDAAFATNAATGVRPVVGVDNTQWTADHPLLSKLRDLYAEIPPELL